MELVERAEWGNQQIYLDAIGRAGGRIADLDGVLVALGTIPVGSLANMAFRRDRSVPAADVLEVVTSAFRAAGRPAVLMTFARPDGDLDAAAGRAGWRMGIELPVLVRTTRFDVPVLPPGASMRALWPADRERARDLLRRGFAENPSEVAEVDAAFAMEDAIEPPAVGGVIASLGGTPSSMSMQYVFGDVATVGWVATVPEARRRGLGAVVTAASTNAAFDAGAEVVTLQASPLGLPVYERLGYERITSSRIWFGPDQA